MRRKGTVRIEIIFALWVLMALLPIAALVPRSFTHLDFRFQQCDDELSLRQLQRIMLMSYNLEWSDHQITFRYQKEETSLRFTNGKLLLQPGTQIFFEGSNEVLFNEEDGLIMIRVIREEGMFEGVLCKAERFCLDNFSDDSVERE